MSISLFNLQREHYELKDSTTYPNAVFQSKVSTPVQELELGFTSLYKQGTLDGTAATPGSWTTVYNSSRAFKIINRLEDRNVGQSYSLTYSTKADNELFYSLPQPSYGYDKPFYNRITIDYLNKKVIIKKEIQTFELVDLVPDVVTPNIKLSANDPYTWTQIIYNVEGLPMIFTGPWQDTIVCTHLLNNSTGSLSMSNSYFETWGHTAGNKCHCRIYLKNSGIQSATTWLKYLAQQKTAGTPVTFYYVSANPDTFSYETQTYEPERVTIEFPGSKSPHNTFARSLLRLTPPKQFYGLNDLTVLSSNFNTSISNQIKVKYLATR